MKNENTYEILLNKDLNQILNSNNRSLESHDTILPSGAFVYILDSTIVIKANDFKPNTKGLLIYKKNTYHEFVNTEKFPIELDIDYDIWVSETSELENLEFKTSSYINRLTDYIGHSDTNDIFLFLKEVRSKIVKDKKCKQEVKTAFCLVFFEHVRKTTNCKLDFIKRYAYFNYYFEPRLRNTKTNQIVSANSLYLELSNKKQTFEFLYNFYIALMS
jgi:hypothetical protein